MTEEELQVLSVGLECKNLPEARFKIGQTVKYSHRPSGITGVDEVVLIGNNADNTEYRLKHFGPLLWEYELEEV